MPSGCSEANHTYDARLTLRLQKSRQSVQRLPHSNIMRKILLILTVNVLTFSALFLIGETFFRIRGVQPYVRTFPGHNQNKYGLAPWAQSDEYLGWTSMVNVAENNPQGFRDKKNFDDIESYRSKIRIMILGDSFIYGAGVWAHESIPSLLGQKLSDKYAIFNLGVPGWGIDQMYLA